MFLEQYVCECTLNMVLVGYISSDCMMNMMMISYCGLAWCVKVQIEGYVHNYICFDTFYVHVHTDTFHEKYIGSVAPTS
jgi:hypothetical protein